MYMETYCMANNSQIIENIKEGVKTFVKKADTNGDGVISLDELKAIPSGLKEYILLFGLFALNVGQLIYNYSQMGSVNGTDVVNSLVSLLFSFAYLIFGGYIKKGYQVLTQKLKEGYEKIIGGKDDANIKLKNENTELVKSNNEKDSKIQFLQWQLDQLKDK